MEKLFQYNNFSKKKRKRGRLRGSFGILLAAAVIFNAMFFEGIAVSASEGTENGLRQHRPVHDEFCTFAYEICSSETTEDDRKDNDIQHGTSESETEDKTEESDSGQTETEEKSMISESETEDKTEESGSGQTEIREPVDMLNAYVLTPVDVLTIYAQAENIGTQELESTGKTAVSDGLNFSEDTDTSRGDLDTDGYHWEASEGSYKLTLKNVEISGTVILPDTSVIIETEGNCSINELGVKNPQQTKLTFAGGGELSINENINISGGNYNEILIADGAKVNANGGICIGASGGVDSVITVNGILTVDGGENNAIYAGKVIIGSSGTLNVSGTYGVALNGTNDSNFEGAFTLEKGGCLTADCTEFNIRVYTGSSTDNNVINVPEDHMPENCEVKKIGDITMLVHKGTDDEYKGPITLHENHDWSENWEKDKTRHWKECKYEGCGKKNEEGKHNFGNGAQCTCGAQLAVDLSGTEGLIYDGQEKKPGVTVKVDGNLLETENYTIRYSANINAGEASVIVTGKDDLIFEQSNIFQIDRATPVVTWSNTVQNLDDTGSEAAITAPVVTLVNNETYSGTIQYSYAAQGSNEFKDGLPAGVGTYTVKASIAAQGNYKAAESGDMTLTIKCGHRNTEIRGQKNATCIKKGYSGDTYCKDCGTLVQKGTETELDSEVHEHTEIRDQKNATCTKKGYSGDTYCKDCNTKLESGSVVSALGHDWHITSKNGKRIYICSRCGATRKEAVQSQPQSEDTHSHRYKEGVLENATCTKAGKAMYTCGCGASYTEIIPALKHEYTHKVTMEPTVLAEGVITYTCSRCGHQYMESIPKLGQQEDTCIPIVSKETDFEDSLLRTDSHPGSGNPSVRADTYARSSVNVIRDETDNAEEQSIAANDADIEADVSVNAVTEADDSVNADAEADMSAAMPVNPAEPVETDDADNFSQSGKQFLWLWWILLIAVLVVIMGLYMVRKKSNKKEQV